MISDILVDYYHPSKTFNPRELALLETRGFRPVRRCYTEADLRRSAGQVVVMDLGRWPEEGAQTFDKKKDEIAQLPEGEKGRRTKNLTSWRWIGCDRSSTYCPKQQR